MNILLCPMSDPGYLYPAIAVGRELRRRGVSLHVLAGAGAEPVLAQAGLPFLPAEAYGERRSLSAVRWVKMAREQYQVVCRAARDIQADVLVTSVLCQGALLAGVTLELPVAVIGLAAHLWTYRGNSSTEPEQPAVREWRTRDMLRGYDLAREQAGIPPRSPGKQYPLYGTALLLRGDPAFEYPGAVLPERVHHVGPCTWEPSPDPAEISQIRSHLVQVGKPIAYVHLGRVFNGTSPWPRLNATFTGGPFQAVVELGRSERMQPVQDADILVVRKPWMRPLIDQAEMVLTSGTSAPVLNGLLRGRPLGVSPAGSEQPLLAEACVRAGVAQYIPNDLRRDPVSLLRSLWQDSGLRTRASELGRRLAAADGGQRAADVIELTAVGRVAVASNG